MEKGANTIATLPRQFKSLSSYDGVSKVGCSDFFGSLESIGLHIRKEDAVLICKFIDREGSQLLDFGEFLFALRGSPNEKRQAAIDLVYGVFCKDGQAEASAKDMKLVFNCKQHPKYKMGKLTFDQMFYLYLKNFNNQVRETVSKKVIK
ncbi:MAG: hypothetical protein MJ252_21215 [archaeon]|nr:hypothetical protein [archaeon]